MPKKTSSLIILIFVVLATFTLGVVYEIDYRILTRKTVVHFANYKLGFYGGKDFRIFETDIAFILTLIPIGFYFLIRQLNSVKKIIFLFFIYLILISVFYCFYCYLESIFIEITITNPITDDEILKYHENNLNYRMILLLSIISTFTISYLFKLTINK